MVEDNTQGCQLSLKMLPINGRGNTELLCQVLNIAQEAGTKVQIVTVCIIVLNFNGLAINHRTLTLVHYTPSASYLRGSGPAFPFS